MVEFRGRTWGTVLRRRGGVGARFPPGAFALRSRVLAPRRMKLKDLQSILEDCRPFEEPKVELEQYTTRPHIAAHILHAIDNSYEGLDQATVVDLGCGAVSRCTRDTRTGGKPLLPSRFVC